MMKMEYLDEVHLVTELMDLANNVNTMIQIKKVENILSNWGVQAGRRCEDQLKQAGTCLSIARYHPRKHRGRRSRASSD